MTSSTEPNRWNELKAKRNQLRDRMNALKSELAQVALTLRDVDEQFSALKAPQVKTSLKTELERALASREPL
jgi:uncharacterized coiled-coil DUF342 family protein